MAFQRPGQHHKRELGIPLAGAVGAALDLLLDVHDHHLVVTHRQGQWARLGCI